MQCKLMIVLCTFGVCLGCATDPAYYAAKGPVYPTKPFEKTDICDKLQIHCSGQTPDVVTNFSKTLASHLPKYYFLAGPDLSDQVGPALNQSDFTPYPFNPLLLLRLRGLKDSVQPIVEVSILGTESKERDPAILFTAMSPQGQEAIIKYLGTRGTTVEADRETLVKLLETIRTEEFKNGSDTASSLPKDLNYQLRLLVSASLNSLYPADRLEKIFVFILIPEGFTIYNIEQVETEKPKIDFGKRTAAEELAASLELPSQFVKGSITPKISRSLERMIGREFARRTQGMNPERNTLFIIQEGQEGIDLNGNVVTNLSLHFNDAKVESVTVFVPIEHPKSTGTNPFPFKAEDYDLFNMASINALVAWVVHARIVIAGGETVLEDDDVILPYIERGLYPISLWRNPETLNELLIQYDKDQNNKCKLAALTYKETGDPIPHRVFFKAHSDAKAFKEYLLGLNNQGQLPASGALPMTLVPF